MPPHSVCVTGIVSNKKGGANIEKIYVEINFNYANLMIFA